jgi:murein L,D-transpeptidase YcbB/YkuD
MAVTLDQVRRILSSDEPDYRSAARLGPAVLPHLQTLVRGRDPGVASRAAVLAGRIDHDASVAVLQTAASSPLVHVRLAAAAAARRLARPAASSVLAALLNDSDAGVRKVAVRSATTRANPALLAKVAMIAQRDPTPMVRAAAARFTRAASQAEVQLESPQEVACAQRCGAEFERCTRFSSNALECLARFSACMRGCRRASPSPPPRPGPRPRPPSPPVIPSTIRRGDRGALVQLAQAKLNNWIRKSGVGIPPLAVDGIFGPLTEAAVRRYQQTKGLVPDGIIGPKTWPRLLAE